MPVPGSRHSAQSVSGHREVNISQHAMMGPPLLLILLLAWPTSAQLVTVNRHFRGDIVTYPGQWAESLNISRDVMKYKKLISNSFRSEFLIQISVFGHVPNFHMSKKKAGAC